MIDKAQKTKILMENFNKYLSEDITTQYNTKSDIIRKNTAIMNELSKIKLPSKVSYYLRDLLTDFKEINRTIQQDGLPDKTSNWNYGDYKEVKIHITDMIEEIKQFMDDGVLNKAINPALQSDILKFFNDIRPHTYAVDDTISNDENNARNDFYRNNQ